MSRLHEALSKAGLDVAWDVPSAHDGGDQSESPWEQPKSARETSRPLSEEPPTPADPILASSALSTAETQPAPEPLHEGPEPSANDLPLFLPVEDDSLPLRVEDGFLPLHLEDGLVPLNLEDIAAPPDSQEAGVSPTVEGSTRNGSARTVLSLELGTLLEQYRKLARTLQMFFGWSAASNPRRQ